MKKRCHEGESPFETGLFMLVLGIVGQTGAVSTNMCNTRGTDGAFVAAIVAATGKDPSKGNNRTGRWA